MTRIWIVTTYVDGKADGVYPFTVEHEADWFAETLDSFPELSCESSMIEFEDGLRNMAGFTQEAAFDRINQEEGAI